MTENNHSRVERRKKLQEEQRLSKNQKPKRRFWKKLLYFSLIVGVVLFLVGVGAIILIIKDAPKFDETLLKDPLSSSLFASDGKTVIAEVGTEKRDDIGIEQIPEVLKDAVLATEDSRFYKHHGIDVKRTMVAIFKVITTRSLESGGGSTITQQLVKNSFLSIEQTPTRKIQEWYLAIQLERRFTKEQILEMYFNKNLYGCDIYGVAKASERFFGLNVDELNQLTLEQAALLAGIPQSPNRYMPIVEDNLERAEERRNMVLNYMNRHHYISKSEMIEAQSTPIEETINIQKPKANKYEAFVNTVLKEVQDKTNANIFEDGLEIYTTIDSDIQQLTEDVLSTNDYVSFPENEKLQTAVVITDTQTGEIKAIGGGRNFQTNSYNYAIMMKRQPGSTIKPILDYGPAIEKLNWSTAHKIKDEKYHYSDGTPIRNANRTYAGSKTIRDHLVWSRNIPALKTFQEVGAEAATEFARSLGFPISDEQKGNEANSIGGIDAASPLVMAGAYSAFGNAGYYIEPHTITKIVYSNGRVEKLAPTEKKVMADYTAFLVTDMLRSVVHSGTGAKANIANIDLAGKTGTTNFDEKTVTKYSLPNNAVRDAWFVGYTPQYTGAVWTGYDKTTSSSDYLNSTTDDLSLLVFKAIMSKAATSQERFKQPESVGKSGMEYYVKGGEKPQPPKPVTPTDFGAIYEEEANQIELAWNHSSISGFETSFEVTYTVDGKTTNLTSTKDKKVILPNPHKGEEYVFTVVASVEGVKSDVASTAITVEEQAKAPNSPSNLQATYDQASNSILIHWQPSSEGENNQYIVSFTVNGIPQTLATTSEQQATLKRPQPGQTYMISVTATNEVGSSEAVSTSVTVYSTPGGSGEDNGFGDIILPDANTGTTP
ncbi:PBP1A family penicillin-binding protein [Niallia sp. Sow4_A1]|uniref:PBP1A family penicillin-binding protein n=1 Tax=Bacillaceae TaxID=186817 RepID=UPI00069D4F60|nr:MULTISPECIES: PBP1A family penicillin-binding protein [Bacillaceae]MCM3361198.1 PBP1A family penicillin-binding protein [Niallia sp. MER TA 168]